MTDRLTQFRWTAAENGYRWIKRKSPADGRERWFLTDGAALGDPHAIREYSLAGQTGLFRNFSETDTTKAGIRRFANRYGLLTAGIEIEVRGPLWGLGQAFEFWSYEIKLLRHAHDLWQMARDRDSRGLANFIKWRGQDAVNYDARPAGLTILRTIAHRDTNRELLASFHAGDVIDPAWHQVQFAIDQKLTAAVSPRLLWDHGRLSLYYLPNDLLSAMWYQFARAIDGDRTYQRCENCRNWFEVRSPDGARADKRFCGDACRARAWRKAKEGTR